MLIIGARLDRPQTAFSYRNFGRAATKILVDIDPAEIAKFDMPIDVPVCADAADFIDEFLRQAAACAASIAAPGSIALRTGAGGIPWCCRNIAKKATNASIGPIRRSIERCCPTASHASPPCRSANAPCWCRSGASVLAACGCICSTPTSTKTRRGIASCSARLYGGDRETRVQQEIVLGIGGVRALKALGISPGVFHLNEGHAGFVVLQRIRDLIEHGTSFEAALDEIRQTTVFTTHTPVPAGHDAFAFNLVEKHLAGCWGTLGPHREQFLALGSYDNGGGPQFNMTALGLRSAGKVNAVSELHGHVTRAMWAPMWPGVAEADRPVGSVTNGVHAPTWIASDLADLFSQIPRQRLDRSSRRSRAVGSRADDSRRRAVERSSGVAPLPLRLRSRTRAPAMDGGARQHATDRRGRHPPRSRSADDRLCAPLRRLQTARADLSRSRIGWRGFSTPRNAPFKLSSRGNHTLRTTSANIICSTCTNARWIRSLAVAWRSSTTTISTSRISSHRDATSG